MGLYLTQPHELENLAGLGINGVDTPNAHNEHELGLRLHEEVVVLLSLTPQAHEVCLLLPVLLGIFGSLLEDDAALNLALDTVLSLLLQPVSLDGLESLALLEHMLRNNRTLGLLRNMCH